MVDLKMTRLEAYCDLLHSARTGNTELGKLLELVLVHESFFYREADCLIALSQFVFPQLAARLRQSNPYPLTLWSCPCARGEEAYTLSFLVREHLGEVPYHVYGTDISPKVIAEATRGRYDAHALRHCPPELKQRYFRRSTDGEYEVQPVIKRPVRFTCASLLNPAVLSGLPLMDMVLCRNLFIYFDPWAKKRAFDQYFQILRPGGYLVLGSADAAGLATLPLDLFEPTRIKGQIFLRRKMEL